MTDVTVAFFFSFFKHTLGFFIRPFRMKILIDRLARFDDESYVG